VFKGELIAPEHDYPSHIEISLRVTDERGLGATETVRIDPRTVDIKIASEPPGVPIVAGLVSQPAPFDVPSIELSHLVLSAPQTAELNGRTYTWQSWSDQGARSHTILADASGTYTAVYSSSQQPPPPPPPNVAPHTKLRKHPGKKTRMRTARFSFSSNEPGSRFRCKLDRRRFRSCRSPAVYRRLKPGGHVFRVVAVDSSGAADPTPATFRWKVKRKRKPAR
jgi:hypothetical protein